MRNKFAEQCYRCGEECAAGDGHFERHNGGWRIQHARCAIKYRGSKQEVAALPRQSSEPASTRHGE